MYNDTPGKITKVLNMRPAEILSMIEEAAGTSMFEDKKDKAVKTMSRKEKRLDEIQEVRSPPLPSFSSRLGLKIDMNKCPSYSARKSRPS